jgi:hypothetical protein
MAASSAAACSTGTSGVGACGTGAGLGSAGLGSSGVGCGGDGGAVAALPGAAVTSGTSGRGWDPELLAKELKAARDKVRELLSKTRAKTKKVFRGKSA